MMQKEDSLFGWCFVTSNFCARESEKERLLGSTASFKLTTDRAIISGKSYDFVVWLLFIFVLCVPYKTEKGRLDWCVRAVVCMYVTYHFFFRRHLADIPNDRKRL